MLGVDVVKGDNKVYKKKVNKLLKCIYHINTAGKVL